MKLVYVYVEHNAMSLNRTFVYNGDGFHVQKGVRVWVSFANRKLIGFVERVEEGDPSSFPYQRRVQTDFWRGRYSA